MDRILALTKSVVVISVLLVFRISFSQNQKIADSLSMVLKTKDLTKEEKAKHLSLLAYHHPNIDTALFLAKQSLQLAQEIKAPVLQAEALEEISHKERKLGNNSKSLQASLKALQIYESLGLRERQAASYNQLAGNYISDENYDQGIVYLKKARRIYRDSDELGNQVFTILNLGEAYRLAGHLDSAATYFKESLQRNELLKNDVVQSYSQGNLGMVYSAQNKLVAARENLNEAIAILRDLGDPYSTSVYLAELGEIYKKEGEWEVAEDKLLEALNMAKQAGLKEQIRDFSATLTRFYETQQRYPEALEYQKLYQVYQDSLVNKSNIQKIEQLKAGYEIDKRETEIGLLNTINTKQKNWVITLAIGVSLLLFFAYLLYKANKKMKTANHTLSLQKEIITKREQEKALLLKELNHRVKNNLQMISSLLSLQSRELTGHPAKEAIIAGKDRVEALSLVHRKLYQEGLETRIMIKEYIEELVLGLFHGYGAQFKPDFEIDDTSITVDMAVPLALIINEMVVNALKYAYMEVKDPTLNIKVRRINNYLAVEVIDNGIGFPATEGKKNNSFGIKLISSLVGQMEGILEKLDARGTHWKMNVKVA